MANTLIVLFGASVLSFAFTYLAPGDLARQTLTAQGVPATAEMLTAMRHRLGLDRPLLEQYLDWLNRLLHTDLGTSLATGNDIAAEFADRLPLTLALALTSIAMSWIIAIPLGVAAALRPGSRTDMLIRAVSYTSSAVPAFVIALLVLDVFGLHLAWFPIAADADLAGMAMPTITLVLATAGWHLRQVRTLALEAASRPFVTGLRLRGMSQTRIGLHLARNIAAPLCTLAGSGFGAVLGGSVVVEAIFSWRGIGAYALSAITAKDHPVIQAYVMWCVLVFLVANALSDLAAFALDPRLKNTQKITTSTIAKGIKDTHPPALPLSINHVNPHTLTTTATAPPSHSRRTYVRPIPLLSCLLGLILIAGIAAPFLSSYDPNSTDITRALRPPNFSHILGTDQLGRDIWARTLAGIAPTLAISITVVALALVIGATVGMLAGAIGGIIDTICQRITAIFQAFPEFILALALAAILGPGFWSIVAALTAPTWTRTARYARILTLELKNAPYIHAARMNNVPTLILFVRHILPNIAGPLIAVAASDLGGVILNLATLSFVGLGLPQPTTEWGTMIAQSRPFLHTATWLVLAPGLAVFTTTVTINLLTDHIHLSSMPGRKLRRNTWRKVHS
ncbi:ABC transporter permease subunit [Dermatophilus congolensis]|uniref:ABC transporter permease subunit n=1 Tax=Dermatophilus congolensis TaxID=1863 RepID=UPI001AB010FA|nr:ABC transporter permease subunit [Dermatophilus congolensis]MBO3152670.1 ABC transporter permease subunit [Dermatophilus congolensis]MBO3160320.1 ABC transporter permease subunit [Dermatophilus congolensis]MBO3163954.1 ABC transporter permease subunit [Dermatophilus congolensis]MBO3177500.1 ABC transporter permease subunit [Dermatophilus congolensis]